MQDFTYGIFVMVASIAATLLAVFTVIVSIALHHTAAISAPSPLSAGHGPEEAAPPALGRAA
jgi:hypothetical protein